MRAIIAFAAFGLITTAAAARAQDVPPAPSPDDYVKAAQAAPCDDGEARDQDGLCPESHERRGFNLGAAPRLRHHPRASDTASKPPSTAQDARGAAPALAPSALDDLRIEFVAGSAEITPQGRVTAKNFAAALLAPALIKRRFEIAGYTDASGSVKNNLALSQARADAVVAFLVAQGVDRSRLEAKGYGSAKVAVPGYPTAAANRRVEAHSLN